jgi:membrane-associated phospholipid phosphatase
MPRSVFFKKITALKDELNTSQSHLPPDRKKVEKQFILSLMLVSIFCVISYFFLDQPVALFMAGKTHSNISLSSFSITDNLTNIAYFITLIIMAIYVLFRFLNIQNRFIEISGVLCLGVVTAFFIKNQLQLLFGRISPRYGSYEELNFVRKKALYGFHFMQMGSFPSGHMVIFTCLFLLFSFYYPKVRKLCYVLLSILAFLLVYDNYHFLSDVVAGTYLGAIIALALKFLLKIQPMSSRRQAVPRRDPKIH